MSTFAGFFVTIFTMTLAGAGFERSIQDGGGWETLGWAAAFFAGAAAWLALYLRRRRG